MADLTHDIDDTHHLVHIVVGKVDRDVVRQTSGVDCRCARRDDVSAGFDARGGDRRTQDVDLELLGDLLELVEGLGLQASKVDDDLSDLDLVLGL